MMARRAGSPKAEWIAARCKSSLVYPVTEISQSRLSEFCEPLFLNFR
jgi:hypothetical protein